MVVIWERLLSVRRLRWGIWGSNFDMIWLLTVGHFTLCSVAFFVVFHLYGEALLWVGKKGGFIKFVGGYLVFFAFLLAVALLFASAGDLLSEWRENRNSDVIYFVFFLLLFVLSMVPGGRHFFNRYFKRLQTIGFF